MTNAIFIQYANMATGLNTGTPINWDNLETMWAMKGKDHVLNLIEREKTGANNIYLCHLSLAETCLNELS